VNSRFKTPVNALLGGAVVTTLFVLLEFASPSHNIKILFITYPANRFRLGKWAWPVTIAAALYLAVMLINVVAPTGLSSPRGAFNYDWITLLVMFVIAVVGVILFLLAHRGKELAAHMHDDAPAPASPDTAHA
jgi:amino acid transporter